MADTIGKFVGNTVGEAAAFAAGLAVGPLLAPLLQALENETWSQYPDRPLAAQLVAQGVAERKLTDEAGASEAKLTGISPTAFDTLVTILRTAPSIAEALTLIRRGQMAPDKFPEVLGRAGLEDEWFAFYQALSSTGLDPWQQPAPPADLALGLIRGNLAPFDVDGEPAFPTGLSSEGSNVPADPYIGIDVLKEAAASGISPERMALLARNVGLPPGVVQGLQMLNRGLINEAAFGLLIEQSDARLSWGPFLLQLRRMILTPHNYAELDLRGWIDSKARDDGAALSGMEPADTQLLYDLLGRPLAVHQVVTALARGGAYDDPMKPDPAGSLRAGIVAELQAEGLTAAHAHALVDAVEESNVRPEFYRLAIANRYTYPSPFVLKALATAGDLGTTDDVTGILLDIGWPPFLAEKVAKVWVPATAAASPAAKSATTKAVTAIQKAYVQQGLSRDAATAELTTLGEDPATFPGLFTAWDVSRTAYLQGLTNAQVRNRFRNEQLTEAEAVTILESRGLTATEATTYLTVGTTAQLPPPAPTA